MPAPELQDDSLTGFDVVIYAVGRAPNTAPLNLEAADVKTTDRGYIVVDEYQNTSQAGVYVSLSLSRNIVLNL